MMNFDKLILFCFVGLLQVSLYAQETADVKINYSGSVTDKNKNPIAKASIAVRKKI